jgi:acetyltransferase-like isoleucine patch superfamily enzyme
MVPRSFREACLNIKKINLKSFFLKNKLKRCGKNVLLGTNIKLSPPEKINLDDGVAIGGNSILIGQISIGTNSTLQGNNYFQIDDGGELIIGQGTAINLNCKIYGKKIKIGNNVMIAHDSSIVGVDHIMLPLDIPSTYCELIYGDITIEDDVWIGCHSIILKNVKIGKRSIIGAGSVVTKDVEPYTVVAGNPAKKIKDIA